MAFLSGAVPPWLSSGMTSTNASAASISALQRLVCSWTYWRRRGWCGSFMNGRFHSTRSTHSTSKASCARACDRNHSATGRPTRPGRVLATTTCSFGFKRGILCGRGCSCTRWGCSRLGPRGSRQVAHALHGGPHVSGHGVTAAQHVTIIGMLDLALVGTGGMMPLPTRWLSSVLVRYGPHLVLFDCGEGTQISLRFIGWGIKNIDLVLISHVHGDHVTGLPGLLLTQGNAGRTEPLQIVGPSGLGP